MSRAVWFNSPEFEGIKIVEFHQIRIALAAPPFPRWLLTGAQTAMGTSKIEWTEQTWNPVTGCTKVSPGCKHCYAERMALRLQAMAAPGYARGFDLTDF